MMEITTEYTDDCYKLNLKGVLLACVREFYDIDFEEANEFADFCVDKLYDYACDVSEPNEVPAVIFVYGKLGEFMGIETNGEEMEEM